MNSELQATSSCAQLQPRPRVGRGMSPREITAFQATVLLDRGAAVRAVLATDAQRAEAQNVGDVFTVELAEDELGVFLWHQSPERELFLKTRGCALTKAPEGVKLYVFSDHPLPPAEPTPTKSRHIRGWEPEDYAGWGTIEGRAEKLDSNRRSHRAFHWAASTVTLFGSLHLLQGEYKGSGKAPPANLTQLAMEIIQDGEVGKKGAEWGGGECPFRQKTAEHKKPEEVANVWACSAARKP